MARSIVRRVIDFDAPDPKQFLHTPGALSLSLWTPDISNTACGVHNGFINPQFPGATAQGSGGEPGTCGPATDPYDRSRPPAAEQPGTCGTTTRT